MLCWRQRSSRRTPLYIDHLGRYVLLDIESPCRLAAFECKQPVVAIVDELEVRATTGLQAKQSLTICASAPTAVQAEWWETFYGAPPPNTRANPIDLPKGNITDTIDVCEEHSRKSHRLKVQNQSDVLTLEGRNYVMHLNRMEFDANIGAGVVAISRTYDRFHGKQRARVLIDEQMAGWWYTPEEDRKKRWANARFLIDPKLTQGKKIIRIAIDPPAGTPLWSVAEYRILDLGKL